MLTCKSVSKALEQGDYDKLPPLRKKLLKLHLRMCTMCGPYNGFVVTMQDTAREYCAHEEAAHMETKLPTELAVELKQAALQAAGTTDAHQG